MTRLVPQLVFQLFAGLLLPTLPFTDQDLLAQNDAGIRFSKGTWTEVLSKAEKMNQLIFLDAYATWCGPCRWMDKTVFPTKEAGDFFNANFVNIKMDMEKGEGIALAKKYDVHVFPSYLFINDEGEVVHKIVGSRPVEDFLRASEKALSIHTQYATVAKKFDEGTYTPEQLYVMAYTFDEAGDETRADGASNGYLKSQTDLLRVENLKFIDDFTSSVNSRGWELMRSYSNAFRDMKGATAYEARMFETAYRDAPKIIGLPSNISKDKCDSLIKAGHAYFLKTLPEQQSKLSSLFAVKIYWMAKDKDRYAKQSILHYKNYPSKDWNELNALAWNFYELVEDKDHLKAALIWALESVRLREEYANLDTLACLYFKIGNKERARDYAVRAIGVGRQAGEDTASTEKMLLSL